MVHVSKNKVSDDIRNQMFTQLSELFIANTRKSEFSQTLYELLSRTERIMLAKRVAIIGMLIHKCPIREISYTLKVSTSTIWVIEDKMNKGRLTHIEAIFERKKYRASFLGVLENILTVGMTTNPNKKAKANLKRTLESFRAGGKF